MYKKHSDIIFLTQPYAIKGGGKQEMCIDILNPMSNLPTSNDRFNFLCNEILAHVIGVHLHTTRISTSGACDLVDLFSIILGHLLLVIFVGVDRIYFVILYDCVHLILRFR